VRRFITAEDVRRVGSGELIVDAGTVVTPQALETAQALGVQIRAAEGAYTEPAPDRGPDADGAAHSLPHMPEPIEGSTDGLGVVVTAVGRNRPGVLAEMTGTLGELGAGIENISQRMVGEYFHLALVVVLGEGTSFEQLKQCMQCLGGEDDYVVRVMHERVFRFMHRI